MAVWEYKVISSGKGGFATPALLESFLNQLGKDEWEIVEFRTQPENVLACTGLARRSTQRDWTLEDAAAAAARTEADKLRAEFEAKFRGGAGAAEASGEGGSATAEPAQEDGYRKLRDTERDLDPDAPDEGPEDEWDKLSVEDELPTFFEALRPHLRRNQRGPGMSVGVDYLAKKWDLSDEDVLGALKECGLTLPEDEDAKPAYVEYDGDLFWVNVNRRGELWVNTKEKPRSVFRTVQATRIAPEEAPQEAPEAPKEAGAAAHSGNAEPSERPERPERPERHDRSEGRERPRAEVFSPKSRGEAPGAPLPQGPALLDRIRPMMRRNRREPGGSGSVGFLSRSLKCSEADLAGAFASLGLTVPDAPGERPAFVEIGDYLWWVNKDSRGGIWINAREKGDGIPADSASGSAEGSAARPVESSPSETSAFGDPSSGIAPPEGGAQTGSDTAVSTSAEAVSEVIESAASAAIAFAPVPAPAPVAGSVLSGVRLLLKETRTGSFAGLVDRLAGELAKSPDDLVQALVGSGLVVPEKSKEKPVFIEHAGEIFWFNRNAKDELWLNAKASKFAEGSESGEAGSGEGGRPRRPKKKKESAPSEPPA